MVCFSGGDVFKELWSYIPECKNRDDYVGLLNYIEDCNDGRDLTKFDYRFLVECLERFAEHKGWGPV